MMRECMLEHQHRASKYRQSPSDEKRPPAFPIDSRERCDGCHKAREKKLVVGIKRCEKREQKQSAPKPPVAPHELPAVIPPPASQRTRRPHLQHHQDHQRHEIVRRLQQMILGTLEMVGHERKQTSRTEPVRITQAKPTTCPISRPEDK